MIDAMRPRVPLADAHTAAEEFRGLFAQGVCCYERWEVAGSVRRQRPDVKDIEHVIIPAQVEGVDGLFPGLVNGMHARLDAMVADGTITKAEYQKGTHRWGERYRGVEYRGVRHELFFCAPETWGLILAIRTGPASLSQCLVTGIKQSTRSLCVDKGAVRYRNTGAVYPVSEEEDFWRLTGVNPCPPQRRDLLLEKLQGVTA